MIYTTSRDRLGGIASLDLRWLLFKGTGYVPDPDHEFEVDLDPGTNEVTVGSYARQTLTTGTRTVNTTFNTIEYRADNPNFGTLSAGESVTGLGLIEFVTDETDSPAIGYWPLTAVGTADIDPFVVFFSDGLIADLREV